MPKACLHLVDRRQGDFSCGVPGVERCPDCGERGRQHQGEFSGRERPLLGQVIAGTYVGDLV